MAGLRIGSAETVKLLSIHQELSHTHTNSLTHTLCFLRLPKISYDSRSLTRAQHDAYFSLLLTCLSLVDLHIQNSVSTHTYKHTLTQKMCAAFPNFPVLDANCVYWANRRERNTPCLLNDHTDTTSYVHLCGDFHTHNSLKPSLNPQNSPLKFEEMAPGC